MWSWAVGGERDHAQRSRHAGASDVLDGRGDVEPASTGVDEHPASRRGKPEVHETTLARPETLFARCRQDGVAGPNRGLQLTRRRGEAADGKTAEAAARRDERAARVDREMLWELNGPGCGEHLTM